MKKYNSYNELINSSEVFREGFKLYKEKKYQEATEYFKSVVIQAPNNGEGLYYYGKVLEKLGSYQQAADMCRYAKHVFEQKLFMPGNSVERQSNAQNAIRAITRYHKIELLLNSIKMEKLMNDIKMVKLANSASQTKPEDKMQKLAKPPTISKLVQATKGIMEKKELLNTLTESTPCFAEFDNLTGGKLEPIKSTMGLIGSKLQNAHEDLLVYGDSVETFQETASNGTLEGGSPLGSEESFGLTVC